MLMFVSGLNALAPQCSTNSVVAGIGGGIDGESPRASAPWLPEALLGCCRKGGDQLQQAKLVDQWQHHNLPSCLRALWLHVWQDAGQHNEMVDKNPLEAKTAP